MKKQATSNGFSLVEVVVAAAILAFALLAIFQMFPAGYSEINYAARQSRAVTIARDLVEELKSAPFDSPLLSEGTHPPEATAGLDSVFIDTDNNPDTPDAVYTRQWTVTEIDTTGVNFEITARVQWQGRHHVRDYVITTRRTKYTLGGVTDDD